VVGLTLRRRRVVPGTVDLTTKVGSVTLPNPILTAAGTAGFATELSQWVDLGALGAVVVKSLSPDAWAGNPAPRVHGTDAGMINAVGLQNPGVDAWIANDLPRLKATGARVVASIWGFRVEEYALAAARLAPVADQLTAVEVNVSCPNLEDRRHMFGHSCEGTTAVVNNVRAVLPSTPLWIKLSPNVTSIVDIAGAALSAGADALVLVNTVMGMVIDTETGRPALGNGGGGLSGPAIRPVAVRAIYDVRSAFPDAPIVGVGGVARGEHAVELMMAGANAVEVGTASFANPSAVAKVVNQLTTWCADHNIANVTDLIGKAHR
jgi:dihydroorotate dehydrogenase (NAD+) catalytic subunit